MKRHQNTLVAMLAGVVFIGGSALPPPRPSLIWNASASVPIGLYRVASAASVDLDDLVVVRPPPGLANYLNAGGYLPRGVPLLKHVAALAGERVCRHGAHIVIDGTHVADALPRDRRGRPLLQWQGCSTLAGDQVFLLNADRPDSLDGRYFGPLDLSAIVGRATPVWTETAPS